HPPTMKTQAQQLSTLYFSYGQFMVYDASVQLPGCAWTEAHTAQGFARRDSAVNFRTLLEFGLAKTTVSLGEVRLQEDHVRAIAVPFLVTSGTVIVDGPEETDMERRVVIAPGNYRLVAAQRMVGNDDEAIDLFFEPLTRPLEHSTIV